MPAKLLSFIVANTNLWLPAYSVIVQSKRGRRVIGEGVILGNYFSINYGMLHGCVVVLGVSIQTALYSIYMKGSNRSGLIYQTLQGFTAWCWKPLKMFATCTMYRPKGLPVLFQPYLLQVMYYDISIPDSFMYTCYRICLTFLGTIPDSS